MVNYYTLLWVAMSNFFGEDLKNNGRDYLSRYLQFFE